MLTVLACVSLLTLTVSAYVGSIFPIFYYNPNPEPLTVTNGISEVDGYVGGFIDSRGHINYDMTNPKNVTIIYPIAGIVHATITDGLTGETLVHIDKQVLFPQQYCSL